MGDLDQYDSETVYLAFWLQDRIYKDGIEGIHYMRKARLWAEANAADRTAKQITIALRKL
ncbi:hypothetical protein [Halonotius roseus]|uniref:Uncharacterized protein n=1 Tax=Halonotius roseus TaxID=2511997 RepID=A0A544QQY3_9EURY|nr:hypothetical protein [Halonotius roseus]TQQ81853.1 hypothetical protein EWF95_02645 [Halonotius roseus]